MLFVQTPTLSPSDYGIVKTADLRLSSPPSGWADEILSAFSTQYPMLPADRLFVTWKQQDETTGSAYGFIGVTNAPRVSIPIIVQNRMVKPFDILIQSGQGATNDAEGVGDMTEDVVQPLTPDTFRSAMDAAPVGTPVLPHQAPGTSWTEDGSSLRLPSRGRTVLAHVIPTSNAQKQALASTLLASKEAQAGFATNGTSQVLNAWLSSPASAPVSAKLASCAKVSADIYKWEEISTDDFSTAQVICDDGAIKTATKFFGVDLAAPGSEMTAMLVYSDGTYSTAPAKVAHLAASVSHEPVASDGIKVGSHVSFGLFDGVVSTPMSVASLQVDEARKTSSLVLTSGLSSVKVELTPATKEAVLLGDTWVLPAETAITPMVGPATVRPMAPDKIARVISQEYPNRIVSSAGQLAVDLDGVSKTAMDKTAALEMLSQIANADELITQAEKTGSVNFAVTIPALKISAVDDFRKLASGVLSSAIPLEAAVKLAAGIGDNQGVDAILGAGLLTEDNLSEFVGLAPEFSDAVTKLARLLLAIRLGLPGDENATLIAMKSLQRVADSLNSISSEVM